MNKRVVRMGTFLLAVSALTARAEGPDPSCQCEKGYYEKVVTCYKQVCTVEQCPTVVRKPFYREELKPCVTTVMVPKPVCVKKPQQVVVPVEKIVTSCKQVPAKYVDPSTGCVICTFKTECCPVKVVQQQCTTILVDVMVTQMCPEQRTVMQPYKVLDYRDETVMVPRQRCEMVPYQTTVRVPCPPLGPNYREVPVGPTPAPPAVVPLPSQGAPPLVQPGLSALSRAARVSR